MTSALAACQLTELEPTPTNPTEPVQQPLRIGRVPVDGGERCGDTELETRVRRALARAQSEGEHSPLVADVLTDLAAICRHDGQTRRAIELLDRAVLILEVSAGAEHPELAKALVFMAELHRSSGDAALAERAYRRALKIIEEGLGPTHPNVAVCAMGLGGLYYQLARLEEAEGMYRKALAVEEERAGRDDTLEVATVLRNLAMVLRRRHRFAEAQALLDRALDTFAARLAPNDPTLINVTRERDSLRRSSQPPN